MLYLNNYKNITKIFNRYLLKEETNLFTISNPVLTIINEHFNNTRFLNQNINQNLFIIFFKFYFFKLPSIILFFVIKKIFSKKININYKSKILIFSHLIDKIYLDKNKDYFFGDTFKKNKNNISFVYLNALKSHSKKDALNVKNTFKYKYIVLNNGNIKFINLFKIFFYCLKERKKLIFEARKKKNINEKNYLLLAASYSFSSSSITNLIY